MSTYLLIASDRLPGVHPSAEDLFRGAYDSLNSQSACRPKMSTRNYMLDYVQKLPDYARVFKDDADAVAQCDAWLQNPPYQLFGPNLGELIMTKELISAAKARVNAETNHAESVGNINNRELQTQVNALIALGILSVKHLTTEGFNEPETGSAGVEIHFQGAAKSMISYGSPILDLDGLRKLTSWLEKTTSRLHGMQVELMVDDEGGMALLLLTESD